MLLSSLFYSCKKSEKSNPEVKVETKVIDKDIAVSTIEDNPNHKITQIDDKYNILGYGYDVTDRYADINSVRKSVVDLPRYIAAFPGRFDMLRVTRGGADIINGPDALGLSKAMSLSYRDLDKELAGFKGTFTASFPGIDPFSEKKYIYGLYTYSTRFGRLAAQIQYDLVKNFFTKEFSIDVLELSPEGLVAKYGTHVLSSVNMGSKLTVFYQAETLSEYKSRSIDYGLRYAIRKVFGLHTGFLDSDDASIMNAITSPKIAVQYIGGDKSKIVHDDTAKTPTVKNIWAWFNSTTFENSEFIDVERSGFVLLSDLIGNDIKKKAVEEYIKVYLAKNTVSLTK